MPPPSGLNTAYNFAVTLSAPSEKEISVEYSTANGTATIAGRDYTAANGTLRFAPGQTSASITVFVIGDMNREANETFFVNLRNATNAGITDDQAIGTILDDDTHGKGKK